MPAKSQHFTSIGRKTGVTKQSPDWLAMLRKIFVATSRGYRLISAVTFVSATLALIVYALTLAPDLTWAHFGTDGGELITASVSLGVPHPPGYPLYTLIGKAFSYLPLGTIAARFNLFSALCMALAAGLVAGTTTRAALFDRQNAPGYVASHTAEATRSAGWRGFFAGMTFAFMPLVWQQAIITEVYALNMLFVALLFWLTLATPPAALEGRRQGIFLGLAITTHLTSLLLAPLTLLMVRSSRWLRLTAGVLVGLTPFLLLPLFARLGSPVVWGQPQTGEGFGWIVTARIYQPNVFALAPDQWASRMLIWLREPTIWVAALLLAAFIARYAATRKVNRDLLLLVATALIFFGYAFVYEAPDAIVLIVPALAMLCIAGALTLPKAGSWSLLLPLSLCVLHFQQIDLGKSAEARSVAEGALREAPAEAVILTSGDRATFTLWYLHYVEQLRDDVTIVDQDLLAFDWYRQRLKETAVGLQGLEQDDLERFRRLNGAMRPICEFSVAEEDSAYFQCIEEPG